MTKSSTDNNTPYIIFHLIITSTMEHISGESFILSKTKKYSCQETDAMVINIMIQANHTTPLKQEPNSLTFFPHMNMKGKNQPTKPSGILCFSSQ